MCEDMFIRYKVKSSHQKLKQPLIRVAKTPQNLHTWFGGRFWPKNEEGFVDSALIPFSWDSGNKLMNRFLKTEVSLVLKPGQSPNPCAKTDKSYGKMFLSGAQHCPTLFSVILHCIKMRKGDTINFRLGGRTTTFCNSAFDMRKYV